MPTRLVLYEGVIQEFITEHALRFVRSTGEEVTLAAKAMVPKETGALAASIHMTEPIASNMRASVEVGSEEDYAIFVHEGTHPHVIDPRPGDKVLFLGKDGFAASVHHPGTHGVKFLTEPLRRIGSHLGFIVTDLP